jgi:hypothetical protein
MTSPLRNTSADREPLHFDFRGTPVRRPEPHRPARTDGIVQAILAWLDAQL